MDEAHMRRCVELAHDATKRGDFPFGSIVVLKGEVVGEGYNEVVVKKEICRHAEIAALIEAQKKLSSQDLSECTLYSTVEPCPMCSFAIQELNIKRVVFGLRSPVMGGYSRWKILQDEGLHKNLPEIYRAAPEVVPDVAKDEVIRGWEEWNEGSWKEFWERGLFR